MNFVDNENGLKWSVRSHEEGCFRAIIFLYEDEEGKLNEKPYYCFFCESFEEAYPKKRIMFLSDVG